MPLIDALRPKHVSMLGRACERWRCARVLDVALARTWSRVPLRWVTEHAAVTASRGGPAATSSNVLHVFDPDVKRAQVSPRCRSSPGVAQLGED